MYSEVRAIRLKLLLSFPIQDPTLTQVMSQSHLGPAWPELGIPGLSIGVTKVRP